MSVPPPTYGGTELVVANLIDGLSGLGHEVTVYAPGDSRVPGSLRSFYGGAVWPPNPYQELAHVTHAIHDLLGSEPFDVVHAHAAPALAFARMIDAPLVYTIHHERETSLCELYRLTQTSTTTMVAISARQAELYGDVCATHVVHHGLDTSLYPLGDGRGAYAAFLGRFAREKGVHVAIDAARKAGIYLRLGGRPHWKDEDYFRSDVEPRLRWPGVDWLGELSHQPKVALLAGAVATLAPIDWEEPFGLVLIESMLCGTPVIAFNRGSVPELVDPGVTGFIVEDLDQMAQTLAALSRGELVVDRARCRARAVRRFSRERMVDDYLAIYQEAIGAPEPAGPAWLQ